MDNDEPTTTNPSVFMLEVIPQEILLKILTYLDVEDLIAISALNRYFRNVYQDATLLVYRAALLEGGMMDASDSSTSLSFTIPSKLDLLKQRRESWRTLRMLYHYDVGTTKLNVPLHVRLNFHTSSIYDFSCGVYVLGESRQGSWRRDSAAVRFLDLSTVCAEGEVIHRALNEKRGYTLDRERRTAIVHAWPRVEVDPQERIVDFGLALREHDLIALITETTSADGYVDLVAQLQRR